MFTFGGRLIFLGPEDGGYHHGNLKEALIEETTRIIRNEGIESVSMRSLSERLDVSRSAAYRHFDGKSALFADVAREGFLGLRDELRRVREPSNADDQRTDRLLAMGRTYVEFALENPAFYRLMFQWNWSEEFEELSSASQSTFDELVTLLEMGQSEGEFRSGDPEEMAFSTWALVHGIAMLSIEGHTPDRFQSGEELTDALTWMGRGLLSEDPSSEPKTNDGRNRE